MRNNETENTNPFDAEENLPDVSVTPINGEAILDDGEVGEESFSQEEENEAGNINVGAIVGVALVFLTVVGIIILIFSSQGGGKKKDESELDKAGSKYAFNFFPEDKNQAADDRPPESVFDEASVAINSADEGKYDEALKNLPSELQIKNPQREAGQAPVSGVGVSQSSSSTRPDTRNSKSIRKIDGLKGQEYGQSNQAVVNSLLNGGGTPSYYGSQQQSTQASREEYITRLLGLTQQSQQSAGYSSDKGDFFSAGQGAADGGQYMPYNSLWDGTIISGALITAINTDNPGVVIARVTENVYSSYDHSLLLIPEGSLLYATYNSSVSFGQDKVQIAWNLLIRPDGFRIALGNMNGVNAQGVSGVDGKVNNHPFETLKALGLVAVYSFIQTEASAQIDSSDNEYIENAMADVYTQTQTIANKIINRALDINPTITIKAGTEIKLITNIPLELPPVRLAKASQKYVRTR